MAYHGNIVQTQWSIDNTVFAVGSTFMQLAQAASYDEVQLRAVYAFEALGSSMMFHNDRIDEGMSALDTKGRWQKLERMGIALGLTSGGTAYFIRKNAPRCVPSFLFATSLKSFLTDQEIGNMMYEMLRYQGLAQKSELRCSSQQLSDVVSAVSGFSDSIIPRGATHTVLSALNKAKLAPVDKKKAFAKPNLKAFAEIYSRIFGSLQKEDVQLVTLHGITGCVLLASSLQWLLENEFGIVVGGEVLVKGGGEAKVLLDFSTLQHPDNCWVVREWRQQELLSEVVVTVAKEGFTIAMVSLPCFVPATSAKEVIQGQYELTEIEIKIVGNLATALVSIAVEKGQIMSKVRRPGVSPRFVKLKDICQPSYLGDINAVMGCYGWTSEETEDAQDVVSTIKGWMNQGCPGIEQLNKEDNHPLLKGNAAAQVCWVLGAVENWRTSRSGRPRAYTNTGVSEAAVYLAGESVYSSICKRFPESRHFRTGHFEVIADNGMTILQLVFAESLARALENCQQGAVIMNSLHIMNSLTLSQLRCSCMASLLPGARVALGTGGGVADVDMVFSLNGYLGIVSQLFSISTDPRACFAIEVRPGYIRWDEEESPIRVLVSADPTGDEGLEMPISNMNPFSNGLYRGIPFQSDNDRLTVNHLISLSEDKRLLLTTRIQDPTTKRSTHVDWIYAVEAVTVATHLKSQPLPSFAEESLAQRWREDGVWSTIGWTTANARIVHKSGTPIRYVSKTYNNEELRFFLAGRRSLQKLFIRHGKTSVAQCIQAALQWEKSAEEERGRMKLTNRKNTETWVPPGMEEQMRSPGWLIII